MVNAGLVRLVVVDNHKAEFWAQIFPKIRLHPDAAVRTGGEIGWAFRKDSPKLRAAVNRFIAANHKQGTPFGNQIFNRYLRSTKYVRNALDPEELAKYERTVALFRKYGDRYDFDALMLTAQGYQESQLDNQRRSQAGAVGVMQVLPSTGKEMQVGDVRQLDPNIHAGTKYLRFMVDRYFKDAPMDPVDKMLFAFASYNAGPAKIARLRKEAKAGRAQPERVVQQRRADRGQADRPRDGPVREQHLQVLRRLPAPRGRAGGAGARQGAEAHRLGRAPGYNPRVMAHDLVVRGGTVVTATETLPVRRRHRRGPDHGPRRGRCRRAAGSSTRAASTSSRAASTVTSTSSSSPRPGSCARTTSTRARCPRPSAAPRPWCPSPRSTAA